MKKYVKPTVFAVLAFIVLFSWMSWSSKAEANEHAVTIGVGAGVSHTDEYMTERVGYEYKDRWYVRYERLGGRPSDATTVNSYTIGHKVSKEWKRAKPYLGLGVTYMDDLVIEVDDGRPLVSDNLSFSLDLGLALRLSEETDITLGYTHNSTAGRTERNRGIDRLHLTYTWRI